MVYRLGLMAFASDAGLGNQTREYFENLKPTAVLGVDISSLDNKPIHKEWYPSTTRWTKGIPTNKDCEWLVDRSDVVLVAETPLNYYLFQYAAKKGVKTVLAYNYEFLDYLQNPSLPYPNVLISPSIWHLSEVNDRFRSKAEIIFLPFPVNRKKLPFRPIRQIKTFVHVAGQRLFEDRNGTDIVLSAIPLVRNKRINFIIYSQHPLNVNKLPEFVSIRETNVNKYADLYAEGDCLLLPRRYGGQSLQLNEAMSTGMIPIMIDCSPNDSILDQQCLVYPSSSTKVMTRTMIDCYHAEPLALAEKIDEFARLSSAQVMDLNNQSDSYAEYISWAKLKGRYEKLFEELV